MIDRALAENGKAAQFFPYPVVAGFTSGIAVIIFCGQLNEFFGLGLKMPEHVPQQIGLLAIHFSHDWSAVAIGVSSVAIIYLWPRISRHVPRRSSPWQPLRSSRISLACQWPPLASGSAT